MQRKYRNENSNNEVDDVFREFENLKNTNKEIMMFMSVLARMLTKVKENIIETFDSKEDKLIANVLVDYQNRADMLLLKEQSIINDYVKKT